MQLCEFSRFQLLHDVEANGQKVVVKLPLKPTRVATMLNADKLFSTGELRHNDTVFFEDQHHDWSYDSATGDFRYYTRVAQVADVILLFK